MQLLLKATLSTPGSRFKTSETRRCWKPSINGLRPYAVKQSHAGEADSATTMRLEAANIATLQGLTGVVQGDGVLYDADEQVYIVVESVLCSKVSKSVSPSLCV